MTWPALRYGLAFQRSLRDGKGVARPIAFAALSHPLKLTLPCSREHASVCTNRGPGVFDNSVVLLDTKGIFERLCHQLTATRALTPLIFRASPGLMHRYIHARHLIRRWVFCGVAALILTCIQLQCSRHPRADLLVTDSMPMTLTQISTPNTRSLQRARWPKVRDASRRSPSPGDLLRTVVTR